MYSDALLFWRTVLCILYSREVFDFGCSANQHKHTFWVSSFCFYRTPNCQAIFVKLFPTDSSHLIKSVSAVLNKPIQCHVPKALGRTKGKRGRSHRCVIYGRTQGLWTAHCKEWAGLIRVNTLLEKMEPVPRAEQYQQLYKGVLNEYKTAAEGCIIYF